MQVGCPVLLELLATCDGTYPVEQGIHKYLADSWHHGEWFSRNAKVAGVIGAIHDGTVKTHIGMRPSDSSGFDPLKHELSKEVLTLVARD